MAKSSRASTVKSNNQRLKSKVFGPVEKARLERISAKLREISAAPKPPRPEESEMKIVDKDEEAKVAENPTAGHDTMEVDGTLTSKRTSKHRIAKRKTSKIVFPKYSDRKKISKR